MLGWVGLLEGLAARQGLIGKLLLKTYHPMVSREIEMAKVEAETRVLHIGGGIPFTAITIARQTGARVVVLDNNPGVVNAARRCVENYRLNGKVRVIFADGVDFSASDFDVIIISISATPKEEVLANVFATCSLKARIVCRSARRSFETIYGGRKTLGKYESYVKAAVCHSGVTTKTSHLLIKAEGERVRW